MYVCTYRSAGFAFVVDGVSCLLIIESMAGYDYQGIKFDKMFVIIAIGNVFVVNEELKHIGFWWNPANKVWWNALAIDFLPQELHKELVMMCRYRPILPNQFRFFLCDSLAKTERFYDLTEVQKPKNGCPF